jgi:hypothetical protein
MGIMRELPVAPACRRRRACLVGQITSTLPGIPRPCRGALRDRHERWLRDAMDAARQQTNDVPRTAKSCGPGAPMQALSSQRRLARLAGDGGNQAWSPRRPRISRKAIAQGRPVVRLVPVVTAACFFVAGGPWVRPAPGLPCALSLIEGGRIAKLGRETRREIAASRAAGSLTFEWLICGCAGGRRSRVNAWYRRSQKSAMPLGLILKSFRSIQFVANSRN